VSSEGEGKSMIKKVENTVDCEFGIGDICVTGGHFIEDDKKYGVVTFSNQTAREIGSEGDIKAGQSYKLGEFPVILTFTKKESIDVVIRALENAKQEMDIA
jgi:hypothetical protein